MGMSLSFKFIATRDSLHYQRLLKPNDDAVRQEFRLEKLAIVLLLRSLESHSKGVRQWASERSPKDRCQVSISVNVK